LNSVGIYRVVRAEYDQRRVLVCLSDKGQQCFVEMSDDMERNYQRILEQFGDDKLAQLLGLLDELKQIKP